MIEEQYHIPVLLRESVAGLAIKPDGIYVDLTYGGGGHSKEILKHLNPKGTLVSLDQDPEAENNLIKDKRFRFFRQNYKFFNNYLDYMGIKKVDGILADLGVSSHQLNEPSRGFSFRFNANLDMRMNPGIKNTAAHLVNTLSQDELFQLIKTYGELKQAHAISRRIVQRREDTPVKTTFDLVETVKGLVPVNKEHKFLAQLFQALRIAVNQEYDSLKDMLLQTISSLTVGGRLVVVSYHSIEDKLTKNFMKSGNFYGEIATDVYGVPQTPIRPVNRQVIQPSDEELQRNPRSRSAKLRIAERTNID